MKLKPIKQQVIVLTGASSGIGLATAKMAAKAGAKLVLASRGEEALQQITNEINQVGGEAIYVVADVGDEEDVRRIAKAAVDRFGGIDTWVNDAGVSIFGRMTEVANDDHRRLFQTNFWGVVYGSQVAVEHLRDRGGVLINVGSTVSERAIPIQGMYSASKHAVKGFTDALRMELEEQKLPIHVTLIKPAAIDTPFTEHAKNYMPDEPALPPPVYAPDTVARAIMHCAVHPHRDVFVGSAGKMFSVMETTAPRLTDRYMEMTMVKQQQKQGRPTRPGRRDALFQAGRGGRERGDYEGHVMKSSLYTQATLHPWMTAAIVGAVGAAAVALVTGMPEREKSWKEKIWG